MSFQQESIPQSKLSLERNTIREKRDIPFGSVGSRRDHVLFECGIDGGHCLLHDTLLDVDGFEETGKAGTEYVVHLVGVVDSY